MQYHRTTLLLGTVLGLGACSGTPPAPGLAYSVAIDPTFSSDQLDAITAGLDEWNAAVPQLKVTYSIAACDSPAADQVCMHPNSDAPDMADDIVGDTQPCDDDNATILIYVDRIDQSGYNAQALVQQTAAHEMGHAMGLVHTASGTLMAALVQDQSPTITPADIDQFWSLRGK